MEKFSNCCGVPMRGEYIDHLICPDCKEHCDIAEDEEEPLEIVTIELDKDLFERVVKSFGLTLEDYKLKKVEIKDGFFDNDLQHVSLKRESNSAYKKLKEYEFNKRNK